MSYDDDFEDDTPETSEPEDSGWQGEVKKAFNKQKDAPERAPREHEAPKSDKFDVSEVEEAVAQVRAKKGDEFPWRDGYGRTGERGAEMLRFEKAAAKSGTTVPRALHDYHSAEMAIRADPVMGVSAMLHRLGHDPKQIAAVMAQEHGLFQGNQPTRNLPEEAMAYNRQVEVSRVLEEAASHPKNVHMRDDGARQWMKQLCEYPMQDGRCYEDHLLQKHKGNYEKVLGEVYRAYDKAHRTHQMEQLEQARSADRSMYGGRR